MEQLKKEKMQDYKEKDRCVVCGSETSYKRAVPIDKRSCYVEGSGQLCERCYYEIYHVNNKHR